MTVRTLVHTLLAYHFMLYSYKLILYHCSSCLGRRGVSGSAACRWYINEDLPPINAIHARLVCTALHTSVHLLTLMCSTHTANSLSLFFISRLKDKIPEMENILLPNQTAAEIAAQVDLETKTVAELIDLDIWRYEVYSLASLYYTPTLSHLASILSMFSNTNPYD